MCNLEVYPYNSFKEKLHIIKSNKGRFTDLGTCLLFMDFFDKHEDSVAKMCYLERNKVN
ncbi:hypothetical protein [Clostridium estertheticum]|uniref:Uncharacterized protein n=1 Tax=Clostridium estertheticum TaxID=238834 RepID=A0AA47I6A5_9CLOT|nr:hypothetical protein [Clostridium estertheticum]MBU3153914.1 hypothetical protein [Clostridium estertheticum]WAG61312.1 hypothetical protein LL038_03400 [Clostridium estertheticum]